MIRLEHVGFTYASRSEATISNINIHIEQGERVLIAGRTGCGKSTLLKVMNAIIPACSQGRFVGDAWIDGVNTRGAKPDEIGLKVGTLYQSPDDQIFATTVWDEVAFTLENQGATQAKIEACVAETLAQVGLSAYRDRSVYALSGGQRQRLALAAVLAAKPRILILDEPISQLNPSGAASLMQLLLRLNRTEKMTLIVVEHRVHELYQNFPRLIYLENRTVCYDGAMEKVWNAFSRPLQGLREPETVRICRKLSVAPVVADTKQAAAKITHQYPGLLHSPLTVKPAARLGKLNKAVVQFTKVSYAYDGQKQESLKNISFILEARQVVAVMGQNGAGKSTLLSLVAGLTQPKSGSLHFALDEQAQGIGFLRQDTDLMLLYPTVGEEVGAPAGKALSQNQAKLLTWLDLASLRDDFPLALSRGQRLRVSLASLLSRKPGLLLLDEPTTGQDYESLEDIRRILRAYRYWGGTVLFCTHDVELAMEMADRVLLLRDGELIAEGKAKEVLTNSQLLEIGGLAPTPAVSMCQALNLPPASGCKEVCRLVRKTAMGRGR